jgi:hypothetical protein
MRIALLGILALPSTSWAIEPVPDDEEPDLLFNTNGIKSVYHDGTSISETILRHVRAFVATDAHAVAGDYTRWLSTLTFGPGGDSVGETFDIVGKEDIEDAFSSFFTADGIFPPDTVLTITSASRIGRQFYQSFDYETDSAECTGSDTFVVWGQKIMKQTAYIICTPIPEE